MSQFFTGYAAVFDIPDRAGEVIEAGAFRASLERNGGRVPMLYQHDLARPVGRWLKCYETQRGLRVEGILAAGVRDAGDVSALIRAGAVRGLSIGYAALKSRAGVGPIRRVLCEIDLIEISIVTIPLQPFACLDIRSLSHASSVD